MQIKISKAKRINMQNQIVSFYSNLLKNDFSKGPENIKVKILEDIIEIQAKGYLINLEKAFLKDNQDAEDIKFVIEIRKRWFHKNKEFIREQISNIVGQEVDFIYVCRNPIKDTLKIVLIIK